MIFAQAHAAVASAEPLLIGVLVTAVTGGAGWVAIILHRAFGQLTKLQEHSERMKIAVFGDPEDPAPNGVRRDVTMIRRELTEHIEEEREVWLRLTANFDHQEKLLERVLEGLRGRRKLAGHPEADHEPG